MSLTVDGFWKAGFWSTTFWADGFWFEGAPVIHPAQPRPDPGAGSGGRSRGKLDISTLSIISRLRKRKRKKDEDREESLSVPAVVEPAYFVDDLVDEGLEEEIRQVIFQANAEIASLEASKKADVLNAALLDQQIERIKRELMRLREEEDILFIATLD